MVPDLASVSPFRTAFRRKTLQAPLVRYLSPALQSTFLQGSLVPFSNESKPFALNSLLFTSCAPEMVGVDFEKRVKVLYEQLSQEVLGPR